MAKFVFSQAISLSFEGVDAIRESKRGFASLIEPIPLPLGKGKGDEGGWGY